LAAAAPAPSNGPWTLTFTVLAADVILLTYLHRRRRGARPQRIMTTALAG
jgi:hypothetical protein